MFSGRVPRSLQANRITRTVRHARESRQSLIDLTATNPTSVGFNYLPTALAPLAAASRSAYEPEPFGMLEARRAVSRDYARRGLDIPADRIILTASTSEAYSLLFKLLCDPCGDAVMTPVPSYPLFEHLTALDGVRAIPYRLDYHGRWSVAFEDLDRCWIDSVRAVLAVSPNNPTGSILSRDELQELQRRSAARETALVIDEVFADYPLDPDAIERKQSAQTSEALTFQLGGLSKSAGLPQVKLAWIGVQGPDEVVREALQRLEVICDAYLSVATPVQIAAPALIESGVATRAQILERIQRNYRALRAAAEAHPAIEVLESQAGWSAVVRVPSTLAEEDLVVELIERDGVLVHPGFFFDFSHEAFVVVSLLPESPLFAEGIRRVLERADV